MKNKLQHKLTSWNANPSFDFKLLYMDLAYLKYVCVYICVYILSEVILCTSCISVVITHQVLE